MKKVKDAPPPLSRAAPEVPKTLVSAVEKMMATDPEKRFQTSAEVRDALSEIVKKTIPSPEKKPRT